MDSSTLRMTVLVAVLAVGSAVRDAAVHAEEPSVSIRTLTSGPKHHFFGYYGITPWNASGKVLLCLESDFQDHVPAPDEPASVGLVDAETGAFRPVAETRAWNFQQGAMLHWNPLNSESEILYNDRKDGEVVSVVRAVRTGETRYLPRPVSAVSHNGQWALSLTYGRLRRLRPVVGYVGAVDPNPDVADPDDDGVFLMDLTTGETKLVVSIHDVYQRLVKKYPELQGHHMWFNHTVFSKDDARFLFLARANLPERRKQAMFTANIDGSDLREVIPFGRNVSHFDWRDANEIIATFGLIEPKRRIHVLFADGRDDYKRLGDGWLDSDGHCTFGPDPRWLATDPGVRGRKARSLRIFNVETGQRLELGTFELGRYRSGDLRCDLHPRWNRTGDAICFDAIEPADGTRQLHVAEVELGEPQE